MEAVRSLKANLKLEGKACGWCKAPLQLGDDAALCTACEQPHHRGCWDDKAGCSTPSCASAPLRRLDNEPAAPPPFGAVRDLPSDMFACPRCNVSLPAGTQLCLACRAVTSPDGIYHGPTTPAPGATKALVLGLIGLVLCGVVLGPLAIGAANEARTAMKNDPSLHGEGRATAGFVLGIVDLVLFALYMLLRVSNR
jgi:hypothetical protein